VYKAVFNNSQGTVITTPALLSVTSAPGAPVITSNPGYLQTTAPGNTVSLTATATGTPAPIVLWQVSTDGGRTFTNIPGATATTYSFIATLAENGTVYQAVFNNAEGTTITTQATLDVLAASPPG
jgi:hypothetical protein